MVPLKKKRLGKKDQNENLPQWVPSDVIEKKQKGREKPGKTFSFEKKLGTGGTPWLRLSRKESSN